MTPNAPKILTARFLPGPKGIASRATVAQLTYKAGFQCDSWEGTVFVVTPDVKERTLRLGLYRNQGGLGVCTVLRDVEGEQLTGSIIGIAKAGTTPSGIRTKPMDFFGDGVRVRLEVL